MRKLPASWLNLMPMQVSARTMRAERVKRPKGKLMGRQACPYGREFGSEMINDMIGRGWSEMIGRRGELARPKRDPKGANGLMGKSKKREPEGAKGQASLPLQERIWQ